MNEALFYWLHGFAGKSMFGDLLIAFLAGPLAYVLAVGLAVFLVRHKDKGGARDTFIIFSAAGAAWGLSLGLKTFFSEVRPFAALEAITPLVSVGSFDGSGAFPSGHTAFLASIVGSLYFYHHRAAYGLALVPLIIGFARVAAGVHWPIDVVGGYFLGLAVGFWAYAFYHARGRLVSGVLKKAKVL